MAQWSNGCWFDTLLKVLTFKNSSNQLGFIDGAGSAGRQWYFKCSKVGFGSFEYLIISIEQCLLWNGSIWAASNASWFKSTVSPCSHDWLLPMPHWKIGAKLYHLGLFFTLWFLLAMPTENHFPYSLKRITKLHASKTSRTLFYCIPFTTRPCTIQWILVILKRMLALSRNITLE